MNQFGNRMPLDYSSAGEGSPVPVRRVVLICSFLTVCAAAIAYYHVNAAAPPADTPAQAADPSVDDYDSIVQSAVSNALAVPAPSEWTRVVVARGQTLSDIFDQFHLSPQDWLSILKLGGDCAQLKRLRSGDVLRLRISDGELQELVYPLDELHTLNVRREERGFDATTLTAAVEHRTATADGTVQDSLFNDGRKAGLSDRLILEFADIFGYDIDFAQDLQVGDRFSVVYEQLYKDGKKLRDGDILAAEFVNQGRVYRAIRYVAPDGTSAYYTPTGQSLRKAFIRTPVDFTRISSGFSLHRWHPILNRMRAHMGTDYAAPIGTPVHAAGNGRIEFMGRRGGYGNMIILRHGPKYETVYGHLSRFRRGLHAGSKVEQGEVIAYVGMTGLATGPHLHYEFRVNGIPVNPVTVTLPRANPLPPQQLAAFRTAAAPLLAALDQINAHALASAAPRP
jgi:murein DD-endopeptidase MepM/ murein hydrolase activator NlpD